MIFLFIITLYSPLDDQRRTTWRKAATPPARSPALKTPRSHGDGSVDVGLGSKPAERIQEAEEGGRGIDNAGELATGHLLGKHRAKLVEIHAAAAVRVGLLHHGADLRCGHLDLELLEDVGHLVRADASRLHKGEADTRSKRRSEIQRSKSLRKNCVVLSP